MISLSYVSCDTHRFDDQELTELLSHCHRSNSVINVTGLLLYNGLGTFIQTLEGEEETIVSLYEQIKQDPRHNRVNCIEQQSITARSFPHWKMGFRNLSNISVAHLNGYSDFLQSQDSVEYINNHAGFANTLLSHFKNQTNELNF